MLSAKPRSQFACCCLRLERSLPLVFDFALTKGLELPWSKMQKGQFFASLRRELLKLSAKSTPLADWILHSIYPSRFACVCVFVCLCLCSLLSMVEVEASAGLQYVLEKHNVQESKRDISGKTCRDHCRDSAWPRLIDACMLGAGIAIALGVETNKRISTQCGTYMKPLQSTESWTDHNTQVHSEIAT